MKKKALESLAILGALVFIWPRLGKALPPGQGGQLADKPSTLRCDPGFTPKQVSGVWRCVRVEFG